MPIAPLSRLRAVLAPHRAHARGEVDRRTLARRVGAGGALGDGGGQLTARNACISEAGRKRVRLASTCRSPPFGWPWT